MLSRWVRLFRPQARPKDLRFKRSLVRNLLLISLIISLLPILLIGTLYIFRSRDLLRQQANRQLESIVTHEVDQLNQYVDLRSKMLNRLVTDQSFIDALSVLNSEPVASEEYKRAKASIVYSFRENPQTAIDNLFDQMFILRPDGSVAVATDDNWITANFGGENIKHRLVLSLLGTNKAMFVYTPLGGYTNKMVLFSTRSYVNSRGELTATLITISTADLTFQALSNSSSFLPGANNYYFAPDIGLVSMAENNQMMRMPNNPGLSAVLAPMMGNAGNTKTRFNAQSYNNTPVMAFAEWLPDYNIGVMMTVAERSVMDHNSFTDPVNIGLLVLSLAASAGLIILASSRLVRPLVQLTQIADQFSEGNWSARAKISRTDEIGLLAHSFNHMADDLSELYHSLEAVVEKRTSQLRTASEVAQLATSTTNLNDTLNRTVALIAERFGFYHVAIYLFDETSRFLTLKEAGGTASEQIMARGDRLDASESTLIGWAAVNNQPRIIQRDKDSAFFRANELLPNTQSEAAIPVAVGSEVLGVLDIHSIATDAFDAETINVFQTLANQISSTVQNTRLLETTQVGFQETSILYRATRQVTQARGEADLIQKLADSFIQLPFISMIISLEEESFRVTTIIDSKTGRIEKNLHGMNIPLWQMVSLLTENRVVLVEDITQPSPYENILAFLLRRGCKSAALVSILESGRLSKVLALGARETGQLTHTRLQPYANLAEVIGASLEKHHVLNTLQLRLAELQTLANFSQAITAETNLFNLYHVLHEQVIQTMGPDLSFAVAIYNQRENLIEFPYYFSDNQTHTVEPSHLGEGLTSILIQKRQPLLLSTEQEARALNPIIEGRAPRSWMGIPLIFAGEVIGAVIIQDVVTENRFVRDDLNLFMTLAPQIATAVRNTQLYTETQQALRAYDQERFLFNTLLNNIPEGISVKDMQGRYIRASSSVARAFNINADDIISKTDFDLMDRETAESISAEEQAVLASGEPEIGLIQSMASQAGKETWIHTSRIPIRTLEGEPYGLLLIQRDITEIKQAEALAQRRAEQVLTAAEIARDTTGTLDVKILLQKSVNLVRDRFGFYHASIFLIDPAGEYAVLRESTGTAGQQMMVTGHRLAIGSKSIVGQVAASRQPLIVNDVTNDPTHLPNPLLPDTRSELAIPLIHGDRVLGALDVQSIQANAFNPEDVGVLGILADQLAVAVVNGELFAKAQELLGKHRLLRQISIAAAASTSMEDTLVNVVSGLRTAMVSDRVSILILNEEGKLQVQASAGYEDTRHLEARIALGQGITGQAAVEKRPVRVDDTQHHPHYLSMDPDVHSELAIPILFSDELIGVLNLESTQTAAFDENDQEILGALGNNLGGVIANIRLVNQIRQQVIRERQLFDVADKIRRSVDLGTILETSTREIAQALGARRATIQITAGKASPSEEGQPNHGDALDGKSRSNGHGNHRQED